MIKEVFVQGRRIVPDPARSVGKGGEADVYNIGDFYNVGRETVLKLYKSPDHPDYAGNPHEQKGAEERLKTNQKKLREFPKNLPSNVMVPRDLATDSSGKKILGFTTDFLGQGFNLLVNYTQNSFRRAGIDPNDVVGIFRNLYRIVKVVHTQGLVFGDFNDLGVFVNGTEVYTIDADSMQFANYYCTTFSTNFVDPQLCDWNPVSPTNPTAGLILVKPHTKDSDLYAYRVMLMQCFLLLDWGPYGGVYRPKDPAKRVLQAERPLKRITVWDREVIYPKPAVPLDRLPDDLLHHLHQVFTADLRGDFPIKLLDELRWTKCSCGVEYARAVCPACQKTQKVPQTAPAVVKGKVNMQRLFQTEGVILAAVLQEGQIRYLYHDGVYRRENKRQIMRGALQTDVRFRIKGEKTLVGKEGQLFELSDTGQVVDRRSVDSYLKIPMFGATATSTFWTAGGYLVRQGDLGPENIGNVLSGQTLFWVGPTFGFGFYRAGSFNVSFVFPTMGRGINDSVPVRVEGQLLDATCYFTEEYCWFFHATKRGSNMVHTCDVIKKDGSVVARKEALKGDEPWMESLRGKYALGRQLFSTTDEGLKKIEVLPVTGQLVQAQEFPDTEPFVTTESHIFLGKPGLYVVDNHRVSLLSIV